MSIAPILIVAAAGGLALVALATKGSGETTDGAPPLTGGTTNDATAGAIGAGGYIYNGTRFSSGSSLNPAARDFLLGRASTTTTTPPPISGGSPTRYF